ncbi:MAG: hypothetical protein ACK44W_08640 [Planctomycetota bacterium]
MATARSHRQLSILLAHRDAAWVDQARQRLEAIGYKVTDCLEPELVVDLLTGPATFDLACVSSELDPSAQASVVQALRRRTGGPRLILLLDELDSASVNFRDGGPVLTHRVTSDVSDFVRTVVEQLGLPLRRQ